MRENGNVAGQAPTPVTWRSLIVAGVLFGAGLGAASCTGGATVESSASDQWWPGYGGAADNSRYVSSVQIDKTNVNQLQVAWTYPHGETGNPLVVRGVVYGRGRNGSIVAVEADTGRELWVRENMNGTSGRGLMYWESADGQDQRLIFPMDSLLQQLDARTGKSILSFGTNGVVDLRVGIDGRDPSTIGNIQSGTPGEVFENLVIVGSTTGEGYMAPPGDIRAYDVLTGELVWTFHTVPRPGEFGYETWPPDAWKYVGGTNAWGELTIDKELGIAYVPLGSPTYDFYGADRIGANLFGTSIVALDARTGTRVWHFQMVHHDLWDMDPSAAPQLTTITHEGRRRDVVAVGAKTGYLYVFDRATGEPIWPIEERPVPQSTMHDEESWPTQPHPTNPPPFSKQTFTVDDISPYLPEAEQEALRARLLAADNQGLFTPISTRDTVHAPTSNGGVLFSGMASEPDTGAVYVVAHDNPGILHLLPPETGGRGGRGQAIAAGQETYRVHCAACHGPERQGIEGVGVPLILDAGAPAFDAGAVRAVLAAGKGRMPAFPHLDAGAVEALVAFLTAQPPGAGRRGRGMGPAGSGAPPELIAGSGSAWTRPAGSGRRGRGAAPYPEGVPDFVRYQIREYHTVGYGIRPPYTTIVKYDLNEPAIQWRIPFGDDPELVARGITGTGSPGIINGLVVTASGLVFGAGHDNHIRAWDSQTGTEVWSSRFGGRLRGSPAMYEMGGRQYLLVPAAGSTPASGAGAGAEAPGESAPPGWVAYALPSN